MVVRHRTRGDATPNTKVLGYKQTGTGAPTWYYYSNPYEHDTNDELHKRTKTKSGMKYLRGGPLSALKKEVSAVPTSSYNLYWLYQVYSGKFVCNRFGTNSSLAYPWIDGTSMVAMGTTGISRFKPGQPMADTGQFLAELRQLPRLPKLLVKQFKFEWKGIKAFRAKQDAYYGTKLRQYPDAMTDFKRALSRSASDTLGNIRENLFSFKQLGSEYLNIEFGWKPFLNDLRKLYKFTQELDKQLAQLRRDNGKVVRRSGTILRTVSSTVEQDTGTCGLYPILAPQYYASSPLPVHKRTLRIEDSSRYWFSGAFRYWIPDIDSSDWPGRAKRALLGINPTPGLLWEVMPWSWLVDWFSSVGDAIDNMSENAAENLVILYGYSMGTKSRVETATAQSNLNGIGWVSSTQTRLSSLKRREKASPFGFGINLPDLSTRQVAILSALGLSRRGN